MTSSSIAGIEMPFCPRCRAEYRDGFTRCADCGDLLVAELPASPVSVAPEEPVREKTAATFATYAEAAMWAELLEKNGVPCVLVPLGPGAGWGTSAWLPHAIHVRDVDVARAQHLLQVGGGTT